MPPVYNGPFEPNRWRDTIWAITSIFESGRPEGNPAAYQNYDAGIVSYGKHQATLASGTLGQVLSAYYARSQSAVSQALQQNYDPRVRAKDQTLRSDTAFRELLVQAAAEPAMSQAQDIVFEQQFYQPAIAKARQCNLTSPLGLAVVYDISIQGGWVQVLGRLTNRLGASVVGQNNIDEERWIAVFLEEREAWLNDIAQAADARGDHASAVALRNSTYRPRELRALAQSGNYALRSPLQVRGVNLPGIPLPAADMQILGLDASVDLLDVPPGARFTVTWRLRNSGNLPWEADFRLRNLRTSSRILFRQEYLLGQIAQPIPAAPGGEVTLSIALRAPRLGRRVHSEWQLIDGSGRSFGPVLMLDYEIRGATRPI
jgi:chitosanase